MGWRRRRRSKGEEEEEAEEEEQKRAVAGAKRARRRTRKRKKREKRWLAQSERRLARLKDPTLERMGWFALSPRPLQPIDSFQTNV